jgi:hypothetical protein
LNSNLDSWPIGWSEPAATNAPVQDEAVQARFGDEQKTHPLLLPWDFSTPFSALKFCPPTYLPASYTLLAKFLFLGKTFFLLG